MADEVFEYSLQGLSKHTGTLLYGKCVKYPFVQNDLWFVYLGTGGNFDGSSRVYFVVEQYTTPEAFEELRIQHQKWLSVAQLNVEGIGWCPKEERPYSEMLYYTHVLKNGIPVRYGLARSSKPGGYGAWHRISHLYKNFPERELWYVAFGLEHDVKTDWQGVDFYIVEKVAANPEFLDAMGDNRGNRYQKWAEISWAHPIGHAPWLFTADPVFPLPPDPFRYVDKSKFE